MSSNNGRPYERRRFIFDRFIISRCHNSCHLCSLGNSMTMIERVARAMLATGPLTWDQIDLKSQSDYLVMSRAAIKAMWEPTSKMVDAAYAECGGVGATKSWQAMVDAAVGETP
jgi:hypothetical protein